MQFHIEGLPYCHFHVDDVVYGKFLKVTGWQAPLLLELFRHTDGFRKALDTVFVSIFYEEIVAKGKHSDARCLCNDSEYELCVIQYRELAYDITLLKSLKHFDRAILSQDFEIDATIDDKEYIFALFVEVQNYMVLLVNKILQIKLHRCYKSLIIFKWLKIVHLLQQFNFELDPRVVVRECLLADQEENFGTVVPELDKVLLS